MKYLLLALLFFITGCNERLPLKEIDLPETKSQCDWGGMLVIHKLTRDTMVVLNGRGKTALCRMKNMKTKFLYKNELDTIGGIGGSF
jgi:hypothetical protein